MYTFSFIFQSFSYLVFFSALDTDITSWGGIIVTPGMPAYNKEEHRKQEMVEDEQDGEQKVLEEGETPDSGEENMEA